MKECNDGLDEANILQNQFTAYLMTAVRRRKLQYLRSKARKIKYEQSLESILALEDSDLEYEISKKLPILQQFENVKLYKALSRAREQDLKILYMKVLEERTLMEIAEETGIGYNTVQKTYYRLLEKIRTQFGGEEQ